jgi:hypothetical protein
MPLFFASEGGASITLWLQDVTLEVARAIIQIAKSIKGLNPSWFIAAFALMQWRISRNNLRLGLYNRRFEVYSSFLSLKIWLDRYDCSEKAEKEKESINSRYLQSLRESRFLFNPRDRVQGLLDEAWKIYFREYCWRKRCNDAKTRGGQSLSTVECEMLSRESRVHEADSARLEEIVVILEEVLEGYLEFGRIGRKSLYFLCGELRN